jgi:hypothetical protein
MYFYVPSYLEDDFDDSLSINGKTCTLNYNATTPTSIVVNINTLDFKSNMKGMSDNTYAIQASKSSAIKKGDYLTDPDGKVYLISWTPAEEINCLTSQIQLCTNTFNFERFHGITYDSDGNSATPCGYDDVVTDIKGFAYRYGMGLYDSTDGQIGIPPTQKICIGIQYNTDTSNIQISDEFSYNNKQYVITDTDYTQMNASGTDGILILYAQVLEGGRKC